MKLWLSPTWLFLLTLTICHSKLLTLIPGICASIISGLQFEHSPSGIWTPRCELHKHFCSFTGFWKATSASCSSPLLVLVNSKSGDNQGVKFLRKFKQLLNPAQVFDLMNGGPELGYLRAFSFWILVIATGRSPVEDLISVALCKHLPLVLSSSACASSRSLWHFVFLCAEEMAAWAGCSQSWINSTSINRWEQRGGRGGVDVADDVTLMGRRKQRDTCCCVNLDAGERCFQKKHQQ